MQLKNAVQLFTGHHIGGLTQALCLCRRSLQRML